MSNCVRQIFILYVVFATMAYAQSVGVRAGYGQFASQAEQIDGSQGNSYMLGFSLKTSKAFFLDFGVKHNTVNETELSLVGVPTDLFQIKSITQKVGYTGIYGAPGFNLDLTEVGSGVEGYIFGGGGIGFSSVVTKVEFYDSMTTGAAKLDTKHNNWKPFWLVGAGLKLKVFYFGAFAEVAYFDGANVAYDPITLSGTTLFPGGEIEPRGFAAWLGICWN